MNIVNLIGKVSMLYPKELPVLDNSSMVAITTEDNMTHIISGHGRFKKLLESLKLNETVAINGSITYHSVHNNNTAIIKIEDLIIL
jgi:hypothetical protein